MKPIIRRLALLLGRPKPTTSSIEISHRRSAKCAIDIELLPVTGRSHEIMRRVCPRGAKQYYRAKENPRAGNMFCAAPGRRPYSAAAARHYRGRPGAAAAGVERCWALNSLAGVDALAAALHFGYCPTLHRTPSNIIPHKHHHMCAGRHSPVVVLGYVSITSALLARILPASRRIEGSPAKTQAEASWRRGFIEITSGNRSIGRLSAQLLLLFGRLPAEVH